MSINPFLICAPFLLILINLSILSADETDTVAIAFTSLNGNVKSEDIEVLNLKTDDYLKQYFGFTMGIGEFEDKEVVFVERSQIDKILTEQGLQISGCTDSCIVKIANILNVEYLLFGNIAKNSQMYTISLRIVNVSTGKIIKTATEDCIGCSFENLAIMGLINAVRKLSGNRPKFDELAKERIVELDSLIRKNPKNCKYLIERGDIYSLNMFYKYSLRDYQKALSCNPNDNQTKNRLAFDLYRNGQYVSAAFIYDELCKVEPYDPQIWRYRGIVYKEINNYKIAKECYIKSLQLHDTLNMELDMESTGTIYALLSIYSNEREFYKAIALLKWAKRKGVDLMAEISETNDSDYQNLRYSKEFENLLKEE